MDIPLKLCKKIVDTKHDKEVVESMVKLVKEYREDMHPLDAVGFLKNKTGKEYSYLLYKIKKSIEIKSFIIGKILSLQGQRYPGDMAYVAVLATISQKIRNGEGFSRADIGTIIEDLSLMRGSSISYRKSMESNLISQRENVPNFKLEPNTYERVLKSFPDYIPFEEIWGRHIDLENKIENMLEEGDEISIDSIKEKFDADDNDIETAISTLYDSGAIIKKGDSIKML